MEDFVWRSRAKIVAIVDIVLICVGSLLALLVAYSVGYILFQIESDSNNSNVDSISGFSTSNLDEEPESGDELKPITPLTAAHYWILGGIILVCVFFIGLQLWAAVMLLKAGTIGEDPTKARGMALFWRNVTIAMLILSCVGYLNKLNILGPIITIVWRGICLFVVHKFIGELESFLKSPRNTWTGQPDSVVISK